MQVQNERSPSCDEHPPKQGKEDKVIHGKMKKSFKSAQKKTVV